MTGKGNLITYINQLARDELSKPKSDIKRTYNLTNHLARFMKYKYGGDIREYKPGKWVHEINLKCERCDHWDCCEGCLK